MKQYNAPTYTGYKTICELIGLSKRYGNIWVPTGEEMNFNSEGYAFVPPTPRKQRLLIIDKSSNGTLEAYAWNYGHYRKLLNFTDPGHAQDIINDIYTNPYYHAASYYTDKIDRLVKGLDLTQFSSVEDMRTHLEYLHERGTFYLDQIKRGMRTFGCAHRFTVISHTPYKLMNLYLANFEGKAYMYKGKTPITYPGMEWNGDNVLRYELESIDYKNMYLKDGIFVGIELETNGVLMLIEKMMLDKIWDNIIEAPEDVSNYIRVANRIVQFRGMFPSVEYTTDYINQLNACIHEPNELRDKFAELFKKLYADNGMVEKVNNTSTLFDSLPLV